MTETILRSLKNGLEVQLASSIDAAQFNFLGKGGLSDVRIGVKISNQSGYALTVEKITWELWFGDLVPNGTYAVKFSLAPRTSRDDIEFHRTLNDAEIERVSQLEQGPKISGYLEGTVYCSSSYGVFEKRFTLLNIQYSITGETPKLQKQPGIPSDSLTGLLERQFLDLELQKIIDTTIHRQPIAFIMADVDGFKQTNDNYGHLAGDEVLKSVASVIKNAVGTQGMAVRYGGDEFSIVLPGFDLDEASQLAEKIRLAVERCEFDTSEGKKFQITVSLGVAALRERADFRALIKYADDVLRVAKKEGKNKIKINRRTIEPRL